MCKSPLLVFYLLVFCCITMDIVYSLFLVEFEVNELVPIEVLPGAFKIALGIEQIWMMIELILHVNCTIK